MVWIFDMLLVKIETLPIYFYLLHTRNLLSNANFSRGYIGIKKPAFHALEK